MRRNCRDCVWFDSPEWPPEKMDGHCELDGIERMPAMAEPCESFAASAYAEMKATRIAKDEEWDEREEKASWGVEK